MTNQILSLLILLLSLSSCRYHEGTLVSNASISSSSELVGYASGEAETSIVLGFGGLNTQTLIRDAKQKLYLNHPLKKGQAYANMGVDVSRTFYPFTALPVVVKNMVVVSADIVNLDSAYVSDELQPFFITLQEKRTEVLYPSVWLPWVERQDSVLYFSYQEMTYQKGVLFDITSERKVVVESADGKRKNSKIEKLYLFEKGVAIPGQKYQVDDAIETNIYGDKVPGIVGGINPFGVLMKTKYGLKEVDNKTLEAEEKNKQEPEKE